MNDSGISWWLPCSNLGIFLGLESNFQPSKTIIYCQVHKRAEQCLSTALSHPCQAKTTSRNNYNNGIKHHGDTIQYRNISVNRKVFQQQYKDASVQRHMTVQRYISTRANRADFVTMLCQHAFF